MIRRIGLTGGIGSGKSTVARMLQAEGAHLIDLDQISRELTAPGGGAIPAIQHGLGEQWIDTQGALDRRAVRDQAIKSAEFKQALERILHPLIQQEAENRARSAGADQSVVFDIPLLVESRYWQEQLDKIIVVDCSETTQVQRVVQRSGWSEDTVRQVIALQASRESRRAIADAVIFNENLTLAELNIQVKAIWHSWNLV